MKSVEISHRTIFFLTAFLGGLWLLFQIKEVILVLFIAVILMSALAPIVDAMTKRKIPKGLAIAITYIAVLLIFGLLITLIITPLSTQTSNLFTNLPQALEKVYPSFGLDKALFQQELTTFSQHAVSFTLTVFSNILTLISVAVLTFYLLLDRERLYNLLVALFSKDKDKTRSLIHKVENKLGSWLRGQVLLSLIIGVSVYILLFALGIPYAIPLAILAGFMEVVPVIGPIISAIPGILIAYLTSPALAIFVALGYLVIQQLENHFIVPQMMKRAVGLNPLIVILAIAIGGRLLGIAGGLLAVPITVVLQIIIEEYLGVDLDEYASLRTKDK